MAQIGFPLMPGHIACFLISLFFLFEQMFITATAKWLPSSLVITGFWAQSWISGSRTWFPQMPSAWCRGDRRRVAPVGHAMWCELLSLRKVWLWGTERDFWPWWASLAALTGHQHCAQVFSETTRDFFWDPTCPCAAGQALLAASPPCPTSPSVSRWQNHPSLLGRNTINYELYTKTQEVDNCLWF